MTKLLILLCASLYVTFSVLGNGPPPQRGATLATAEIAQRPLAPTGSLPVPARLSPDPGPSLRVLPLREPEPAPAPRPKARPPVRPSDDQHRLAAMAPPSAGLPAIIIAPNAHLRAAPDGMARIVGRLPQGTEVLVLQQDSAWSRIRLGGIDGIRLGMMEGFVYTVLLAPN